LNAIVAVNDLTIEDVSLLKADLDRQRVKL